MKNFSRLLFGCCLAVTLGCETPPPDDSLTENLAEAMNPALRPQSLEIVAPDFAATLEKNEHVAVVRIGLIPGARIPEHDAVRRAVYALGDCSLWMTVDGNAQMVTYSAGDADTWAAGQYEFENAGDEKAELVVVSRFENALPEDPEAAPAETSADDTPAGVGTIAADPYFEFSDVSIEPGQSQSLYCEHPCVVYTVTSATIGIPGTENADVLDRNEYFSNRAAWFNRGSNLVVEAEDEPVRLVVFEVKK